jgi:hypothetical protein
MKFKLEIDCDNDAFASDAYEQVALILIDAAKHLRRGEDYRYLHDTNGNRVGGYALISEPD